MILVLAKAADCSWTTVKELLLMYVAERNLQTEDLARTFERYSKLAPGTARTGSSSPAPTRSTAIRCWTARSSW